jgi:ATP-dependent Clp protease adaptor protein ClpS
MGDDIWTWEETWEEVMANPDIEFDVEVELEVTEPKLWRVIFHNDDKTTMQFVVFLLVNVFHKTLDEAAEIMLTVHNKGAATVGVYPFEIAEEKCAVCLRTAKAEGFPLVVTIEEDT